MLSAIHQIKIDESKGTTRKALLRLALAWVLLPSFFFLTGGSFYWWSAWLYCAIFLLPMTLFIRYMLKRDPDFIERRLQTFEKERIQQRIICLGYPCFLATLLIPALDHRFNWSKVPNSIIIAALSICLISYLFVLRVLVENRWAARTIETFKDQLVISTGPYSFVRHPMYFGTIALFISTPLALGSWWSLLTTLPLIPIFVIRIRNEEEVLSKKLPGYTEYVQKVRYRLVPLVW